MTEQIKDGGQAFPQNTVYLAPNGQPMQQGPQGGMTLRDFFAAKAIPLAMERLGRNYDIDLEGDWTWDDGDWEAIANHSFALADAMLKARERA